MTLSYPLHLLLANFCAGAGADVVMLDNFSPSELARTAAALKKNASHVLVEASGGITAETVQDYMSPGGTWPLWADVTANATQMLNRVSTFRATQTWTSLAPPGSTKARPTSTLA